MSKILDLISHRNCQVDPEMPLSEAAQRMLTEKISSVIVVENGKSAVGIVTEADILHAMREQYLLQMPVCEAMTSPVHTIAGDVDIREAYQAAARLGIRHLVVVDPAGHPVGVVSETDFREHLGPDFYRQLNSVDVLMERLFPRLPPEAPLESALAAMETARASCTIVVDGRKPVGILTERDVVRLFLERDDNPSVGEVMTPCPTTVQETASLAEAAELMAERHIRHLVVTDARGHAVGLLSEHTLMRPLELDMVDDALSERRIQKKKNDEALLLRNAALAGLIRGEPLAGVLELIALSAEVEVPGWRCSIMIADDQGKTLRLGAAPRMPDEYTQAAARIPIREGAGSCGTAAARGQRVSTANVANDPNWANYLDLARKADIAACWSDPIFAANGELLGTFAAFHHRICVPQSDERNLFTHASQLAALVLSHQRSKQQLEESRNTFRGIFDSISESLFIQASDGTFLDANRCAEEAFGVAKHEIIGKSHTAFAAPGLNDLDDIDNRITLAFAGQPQSFEFWGKRANGDAFPMEVFLHPGVYFGRNVLIASAIDITRRKRNEERQRLAASVFDNAHEGIMITDPKGCIVEVNSTFTALTGYRRDEAIGRNANILNSGHHDAQFYQAMWTSIRDHGHWRGEVWNRKKSGEIFVEQLTISGVTDGKGKISHYVAIFSDITLLKEHQQRLEHLAHFDALTQLPNRILLADRLYQAMSQVERSKELLAICYLDLDNFKPVNDRLGHAAGDQLLIEVAERLRRVVRNGDTISRLGGDEFVILLARLSNKSECDAAITRILESLATPFRIHNHDVSVSASIGVTLYPLDAADADTLMRHADQAMYIAKQNGRNCHHLFDPEVDRQTRARREGAQRVHEGILAGEMRLHYQPKVDMRRGEVIGAEALIRWQHPEQGLLLPGKFLPVIEDSDLSAELGEWVLEDALAQLAQWNRQGLDLKVSVNIAGNHLQAPDFCERLEGILARHPEVRPSQLELEVLETAAFDDVQSVAHVFERCRALGVQFALDDFGTGYSSLTYLRRLPAEILKIDQSFVRSMLDDQDDLAIVEGVIGLAEAFQRDVIAEGVETVEHGLLLLLMGCNLAQGFGIARPMPPEALPAWIASFRPDPLWPSANAFQWSRDNLPMLVAEVDHMRWMKQLYDYLENHPAHVAPPAINHKECGFGRWYYGSSGQSLAHLDAFEALGKVHSQLHDIGRRLVESIGKDARTIEAEKFALETTSLALRDLMQRLLGEVRKSRQSRRR